MKQMINKLIENFVILFAPITERTIPIQLCTKKKVDNLNASPTH